jgi:hypothetical protein
VPIKKGEKHPEGQVMVRTVLWLMWGSLLLTFTSVSAFAEDSNPFVDRLGLRTGSPPTETTGDYSLSRFNFNQTHESFNLQNARDMPTLVNQGGSSLYEASNDIPLFHKALTAEVKMVYREPFVTENAATPVTNRMGAQIAFKWTTANMKYQAQYGYSGQETGNTLITTPNDRVGGKLVWEWNLPLITPKIEVSRFTSNVEGDLARTQTVANQQKFSLLWASPNWPSLSIGYARQQTDIYTRPEGPLSNAITTESLSTNLSFLHGADKGDWSSYYKTSQSEFGVNGTQEEIGTIMTGTLNLYQPVDLTPQWGFTRRVNSRGTMANDRFFAKLGSDFRVSTTSTLKPGVEFARDLNRLNALHTDTLAANLGYGYLAVEDSLHVSILGQYILSQRANIPANPQIYDVSLLFKKDVRDYLHLNHRQQILSLKIAHNQPMNTASFQTQSGYTSAMLLVSIIP